MKLGQAADWAKELIEYANENKELLTEWQQEFIDSYGKKVLDFEDECFISVKQLEQLNKIAETLGVDMCDEAQLAD